MQIVSKINPLRLYLTDVMDVRGSSLTRGNLYIIWENTLEGFLNKLDDLNGNKTKFHINQVELLFAPLNRTSKFNNIPYRVNNLDKTVKKGMGAHKYKIVNSPSMLRNLNTAPVMFDLINFASFIVVIPEINMSNDIFEVSQTIQLFKQTTWWIGVME